MRGGTVDDDGQGPGAGRQVIRPGVFRGVVADTVLAWYKDHRRRIVPGDIDRVVTRAGNNVSPALTRFFGGLAHPSYERIVERHRIDHRVQTLEFEFIESTTSIDDELDEGVYAVSCPVRVRDEVLYSVGVVGIMERMLKRSSVAALVARLQDTAIELGPQVCVIAPPSEVRA